MRVFDTELLRPSHERQRAEQRHIHKTQIAELKEIIGKLSEEQKAILLQKYLDQAGAEELQIENADRVTDRLQNAWAAGVYFVLPVLLIALLSMALWWCVHGWQSWSAEAEF